MNTKTTPAKSKARARQIIGFSLPPDLAVEVKTEAAKRNVSLRDLFAEMWALYKKKKAP